MSSIEIKECEIILGDIKCPFCHATIKKKVGQTFTEIEIKRTSVRQKTFPNMSPFLNNYEDLKDTYIFEYLYCPYCEKISARVKDLERNLYISIYPSSNCKKFPDTVPKDVYKDYSEACNILSLSPSASATLSRRCLQKMIRNHWGIELSNLVNEINKIPNTDISKLERDALHAVRQIGNIGAHPDKIVEVEPEDAALTIKIIEIFLQKWYVDDPANQDILENAIKTNQLKRKTKK